MLVVSYILCVVNDDDLINKDSKIIDINKAAHRLLSLNNSDIGKSIDSALSDYSEILEYLKTEKSLKKTVKVVGINNRKLFSNE